MRKFIFIFVIVVTGFANMTSGRELLAVALSQKSNHILGNQSKFSNSLSMVFMPVAIESSKLVIPNTYESTTKNDILNRLHAVHFNYYNNNLVESSHINVVLPQNSFIAWESRQVELFSKLRNLHIGESIELPYGQYIKNESLGVDYVLLGQLNDVMFNEYKDYIENTDLVSIIVSFNVRVFFVVIDTRTGQVLKKFIASGHSGVSKLVEKRNIKDIHSIKIILNEAFNNLGIDIADYLNDYKLTKVVSSKF